MKFSVRIDIASINMPTQRGKQLQQFLKSLIARAFLARHRPFVSEDVVGYIL